MPGGRQTAEPPAKAFQHRKCLLPGKKAVLAVLQASPDPLCLCSRVYCALRFGRTPKSEPRLWLWPLCGLQRAYAICGQAALCWDSCSSPPAPVGGGFGSESQNKKAGPPGWKLASKDRRPRLLCRAAAAAPPAQSGAERKGVKGVSERRWRSCANRPSRQARPTAPCRGVGTESPQP